MTRFESKCNTTHIDAADSNDSNDRCYEQEECDSQKKHSDRHHTVFSNTEHSSMGCAAAFRVDNLTNKNLISLCTVLPYRSRIVGVCGGPDNRYVADNRDAAGKVKSVIEVSPRVNLPTRFLGSSFEEDRIPVIKAQYYNKPTYVVLVGNVVRVYDKARFASLPNLGTFMVEEQFHDASGHIKAKLALKSTNK